jgi:hypothetical protein
MALDDNPGGMFENWNPVVRQCPVVPSSGKDLP